MIFNDKFFYFVQALIINVEFSIFDKIRPFIYRPFFRKLGQGTRICAGVQIKYPSKITIDENVYIGRGGILVGNGEIRIGKDVMIGAYVKICTTAHVTTNINVPIMQQGLRSKPIVINDNVWLGFDVAILLGSIIGSGSIVGANSVLTEDSNFAENSIIIGSPAILKGSRANMNHQMAGAV